MTNMNIVCFHTCKNTRDRSKILRNVPFLSKPTGQWLGQGRYFWTDSVHFAHIWGEERYGTQYVITKFDINIPRPLFLDLVGNVDDQLTFQRKLDEHAVLIQELVGMGKIPEAPVGKAYSVSTVITQLRNSGKFPFKAVKAHDISSQDTQQLLFVDGRHEKLHIPTRQQLVLYVDGRQYLSKPEWIHP
jgi:hypothetical protein